MTTRAVNELSPPKSACAGDAVLQEETELGLPSGGPKGGILPGALLFALVYYVDQIPLVLGFSLVCFQFRGPKNGFFPVGL